MLSFCDEQKLHSDEIFKKLIKPVILVLNTLLPGLCKNNKKCHKHVTNAPKGIGLA